MSLNLDEIKKIRDERLEKLQQLEQNLYSSRVQLFWEQNGTEAEKAAFVRTRNDITLARVRLENVILEQIAGRLRELENDIQEGIEALTQEIENLNNTATFLGVVNRVAGILSRILLLV